MNQPMKLDPTLKARWECIEPGWWTSTRPTLGVCLEKDNNWHSYITTLESPDNTPAFKTMREAMIDAERRYDEGMKKGKK
jgi:hypothetical protein